MLILNPYNNKLIKSIITLIAGFALLFLPGLTMQTAMVVIGVMLLSSGLVTIFLANRRIGRMESIFSIQGLFNILAGLVFIIAPTALLKMFILFLGIILTMIGIFQVINAIRSFSWRSMPILYLLLALLMLSGGILLLYNPFESLEAIVSFMGILLIFYGLSLLMSGRMKPKQKFYKGSPVEDISHEEL